VSLLEVGGMGEVYRACDVRLRRDGHEVDEAELVDAAQVRVRDLELTGPRTQRRRAMA
jgi:hypothetical protein